ncbi:MAG: DUF411 domain-containing protein [Cyanobacteria bacterium]|nr:DUF411 domain-containing protein [Cyanobacteria bacterium CG_2015-16_32_12]NCO79171.1 DUF411 domain-containing protein [Cyanobacteria bacterium CG_2015-22_32_23]NCQ04888.1 DUF411 domain-containing protein [Cyanobacteria bacterium CG_2015-09_32_10]NCQ41251.1 DUF411 domain-containing protein [Cyanobacteria bacterium CG_2015-04_32_10]NCS85000.1 DUF411 domain-containing protein [Cyanobacteria bacterium CG_2015-02_32_10]
MIKTKIIQSLTGIVTVAIIGSIAFSINTPIYAHQTHENHENKSITLSVWDKEMVNYNGNKKITVYNSPSCGCCKQWMAHMKKHGFEVTDIKTNNLEAIKQKNSLPSPLASCHTAIIDGYVMEGHIPADDIKRFLTKKPNMKGLAVAQMPIGSPGMESDKIKQPFDVVAFNNEQIKVFNSYKKY